MPADSSAAADNSSSGERLQKLLASAGFGSRRACEELIIAGRVTVDGVVASLGTKVNPQVQQVAVDGEKLKIAKKVYYLVHKPTGFLCTTADPAGRRRVIDLVPPSDARLFTVGRLDENTEGLILVTNDGELAHRLAHPKFQVERVYRAMIAGKPEPGALDQLRQGFFFTEGKFRVRDLRIIKQKGMSTLVEVVMTEGQNREVRRLFARVGHKVMHLQRIAFGPLRLGQLEKGAYRPLRGTELQELVDFVSGSGPRRQTRPSFQDGPPRRPRERQRPDDGSGARPVEGPPPRSRRPPRADGPPRPMGTGRGTGHGRPQGETRSYREGLPSGEGRPAGNRPAGTGRPGRPDRPKGTGRPKSASRPKGTGGPPRGKRPPKRRPS